MAEEARYARTTISVPPDLKRRIKAVEEVVNWSALACQTFEAKLSEIASRKVKKTMDDVIQRLRASKQRDDDEDYRIGEAEGRLWAAHHASANAATPGTLPKRTPEWRFLFISYISSTTPAERLAVYSSRHRRWQCLRGCRGRVLGPDNILRRIPDTASFVQGFADGALAVWMEVKDHVDRVPSGDPVSQGLSAREPLVDHPIDIEDFATTVQKTPHAQVTPSSAPHAQVTPSSDEERFWTELLAHPQIQGTPHAKLLPHKHPWLSAHIDRAGALAYNYNIKAMSTNVELHIQHTKRNRQQNYPVFSVLQQQQAEIEKRFGGPLQWVGSPQGPAATFDLSSRMGLIVRPSAGPSFRRL